MVSVDVTLPEGLRQFDNMIDKELADISSEVSKILVEYTKRNHRYEDKTGTLTSAIKTTGKLDTGMKLEVDLGVADYGRYVVKGHGTWMPDNFIVGAIDGTKREVEGAVEGAINKVTSRLNRG